MTDEAKALVEWFDKTKWVQDSVQPHELGLHRADVLRNRIETQAREIERLRGALEQIAQADYGYTDIIESGAPPEKHADYFCSMVTWRQRTARAALAGDSHDQ